MRILEQGMLFMACCTLCFSLQAQAEKKVFTFEKGQILDIILLSQKADTDSLLKAYFNTAIPVAKEMGYQPQGGYGIVETPLQGNYHPDVMAIGRWEDRQSRAAAMQKLEAEVTGFHEMRRAIWSNFDMTYWEMPEAVTFAVDPQRYNVVTAYWENDGEGFGEFLEKWEKQADKNGGDIILALHNGISPFGYFFKPDYLCITAWDSENDFQKFYEKNMTMDHKSIQHVNQFRIQ